MSDSLQTKYGRLELVLGNIIEQPVDAIVNAANTKLSGGGGVDGAIHRAAGPTLKEECLLLPADERGRRCPTGQVRVTGGGNLFARWVIHAVGPFYNERYADKAGQQLRQVHQQALQTAAGKGCRSVAFPAISTGAYRFPLAEAASIALGVAVEQLQKSQPLELVRFVLLKPAHLEVFRAALQTLANRLELGNASET
jgi:O-acetyl-ADP-ribose deacetylase (regulator of RNase III)